MNNKVINFDLDGTLVDFYSVPQWLNYLECEDVTPYKIAHALGNLSLIARYLNRLQRNGYTINVISWCSRSGSAEYNKAVTATKREWLKRHLPSVQFDNLFIVNYGIPKSQFATGILFDDEKRNRTEWESKGGQAFNVSEILNVLKGLN